MQSVLIFIGDTGRMLKCSLVGRKLQVGPYRLYIVSARASDDKSIIICPHTHTHNVIM